MTTIDIKGIPVDFPFPPYDCQVDFMKVCIDAITSNSNAVLESPTGTGKTLCLLCSTLAWQKSAAHAADPMRSSAPSSSSSSSSSHSSMSTIFKVMPGGQPRTHGAGIIIYASRTHSQLKQVVSELKSTGYHPKMTILGSREQLCIHDKISKLKGSALNQACNARCAKHSCQYKNNLEGYEGNSVGGVAGPIQDIEDLVSVGKKDKICPYYFSKDSSESADLILLPYNYLMDGSIRCALKINWEDSIVIFDEAHNLERVSSDASSFTLSNTEIAQCIAELKVVLRKLQEERSVKVESNEGETKDKKMGGGGLLEGSVKRPGIQIVMRILKALFEIEKRLDDLPLSRQGSIKTNSCVHPGGWLVGLLEACGLLVSEAPPNVDALRRCSDLILEEQNSVVSMGSSVNTPDPKLSMLAKYFTKIYRGNTMRECMDAAADYRVYVEEEVDNKDRSASRSSSSMPGTKKRVINFWCFSSGQAMQELKKLGVKSIIMTSGTLSPMDAFCDDMNIPIPIKLENPHVIKRSQIYVGAVAVGPNGKQLNSSYNIRDTNEYKDELGASIFMICQTMGPRSSNSHIPSGLNLKGGILVFFPSYGLMESAVDRWKQTGMYERLITVGGGIIIEPRGGTVGSNVSTDPKKVWKDKYSFQKPKPPTTGGFVINSSGSNNTTSNADGDEAQLISGLVSQLDATLAREKRCIMLAVCRGKVSEGIDFKDSKGRVVIITGIPYAPHMDPWVVLKKQYLDEKRAAKSSNGQSIERLSGQAWYMQSASRAVNQAIGRVIRHKNDWGAIFLMDDRFLSDQQANQLSGWVRPNIQKYGKSLQSQEKNPFISALNHFYQFSSQAMNDPLLNVKEAEQRRQASRVIPEVRYEDDDDDSLLVREEKVVVLKADSIKDTDSSTFVDPALLVPQVASRNISRTNSLHSCTTSEKDQEINLLAMIGRMKRDTSLSQGSSSSTSKSLITQLGQSLQSYDQTTKYTSLRQNLKESSKSIQHSLTNDDFRSGDSRHKPSNDQDQSLLSAKPTQLCNRNSNNSNNKNPRKLNSEPKGLSADSLSTAFDIKEEIAPWKIVREEAPTPKVQKFHSIFNKRSSSLNSESRIAGNGDSNGSSSSSSSSSKSSSSSSSSSSNSSSNTKSTITADSFDINKFLEEEKDEFGEMKTYIAGLKPKLDRSEYKAFKMVVTNASATGLTQLTKINEFVSKVVTSLDSLDDEKLGTTLDVLKPLVPTKYRDIYASSSRKTIQTRRAKRRAALGKRKTGHDSTSESYTMESRCNMYEENLEDTNVDEENIESVIQLQSENNTSSRRALALLELSQQSVGKLKTVSTNNILTKAKRLKQSPKSKSPHQLEAKEVARASSSVENNKKKNLQRIDGIGSLELKGNSSSGSSKIATTLKSCLICRESTVIPYAASCGHICCFQCWKHWFKVKQACPACRCESSMNSIFKISIQS